MAPAPEPVHSAHFKDGYPLCWSYDMDGPHTSTYVDADVTCPDCIAYMEDPNADLTASGD